MKDLPDERAEEECGERGKEHKTERFAEFAQKFAVKNDAAVERERSEERGAHGRRNHECGRHSGNEKIRQGKQNNRTEIRDTGREC